MAAMAFMANYTLKNRETRCIGAYLERLDIHEFWRDEQEKQKHASPH